MNEDMQLLLRRANQAWRRPQVGRYTEERALQELLLESPSLIPGVGGAAVVDELHVAVGSVDLVAVEPSGAITLVECKLAANSEARRAVVGQIVSYASALRQLSYEQFDARFHQRGGRSLSDSAQAIARDADVEWDDEAFRAAVNNNLAAGSFRLVIAVDAITDELKGIVEYLNTHTTSEVEMLAFELGYVADGDVEILLPRTHGQESARLKGAELGRARRFWSVEQVYAALDELCTPRGVTAVRRLAEDLLARGGKLQPGQGAYPTMSGYTTLNGDLRALWAVYADPAGASAPRVSLNFGSWRQSLDDTALESVAGSFAQHDGLAALAAAARAKGFDTYPTIPIDAVLAEGDTVDVIIEALDPYLPPAQAQPDA